MQKENKVDILLGLQWGDEGKGKIVDVFTPDYDIIARFQGGPNAGHTLEFNGQKHVLHTIPSGIFHDNTLNIIGNGVIMDLKIMQQELDELYEKGANPKNNLYISKKCHLITPSHRLLDAVYEAAKGKDKIGSTLKGIGPTYTDKTARLGLRMGDVLMDNFQERYGKLKLRHLEIAKDFDFDISAHKIDNLSFDEYEAKWMEATKIATEYNLIDSEQFINDSLKAGKTILAEGAQGTLLDVDFGSYPFVTSSNTISAAVCTGLGVAPNKIGKTYGVFKAYCTRVGSGPFPTELFDDFGQRLRDNGHEYGSTTGRPRRCGWLDIPALRYSIMINGVTDLIITKADVMDDFDSFDVCTQYEYNGKKLDYMPYEILDEKLGPIVESKKGWNTDITKASSMDDLPAELIDYIKYIEETVECPISVVSVGPDRSQTIIR
ncbi:MAG: adenylosuccinate synthase [Bacteroidales bacterium]|nr:adenylosuccinate synthase [Bacteroidales bacterium]